MKDQKELSHIITDEVNMTIKDAIERIERESNEKAMKFETKIRNLTKLIRDIEMNAKANENLSPGLDSIRPELNRIKEKLAKATEENKLIANKVIIKLYVNIS
jgi:uncharacterized phage infection (PIP) family protein YhgE